MGNSVKKGVPSGWWFYYPYDKSKYCKMTCQEYVKMLEDYLNERECSYSVVYYKYDVRIHVMFSALRKMGFDDAVQLSWMEFNATDVKKLIMNPWTFEDVRDHVKEYFIKYGLDVVSSKTEP